MANSQGTQRTVALAKESTFGTKPAKTTAKILPRIETSLNTAFDSFQSEEIRADMQRSAPIVGFEKVEGDLKGELSAGQWAWAFAAALRGSFTAQAKSPIITKTTAGTGEKNGKILIVPQTAHTTDSFTIEDFFKDVGLSRQYLGCRVSKLDLEVEPNGIAKVTVSFLGQRGEETTAQYFTNPPSIASSGKLAGVNGSLRIDKQKAALVTSFKLSIDLGASSEAVLGEKFAPDVFIGTVSVSGSGTMYFQDKSMIDAVRNGRNLSLALRMDAETTTDGDYVTIVLPAIKLKSIEIDDGAKNLMQSFEFDAFPGVWDAESTIDNSLKVATTMIVQDTLA